MRSRYFERDGFALNPGPGILVNADTRLGGRAVLEYVLSPVQKAFHEAGPER